MKKLLLSLLCLLPLVSCSQINDRKETESPKTSSVAKGEEKFTTLKFELDGKPCVAVINNQYRNFKSKPLFPLSLFLTIRTHDQDENGHPTEKEARVFHDLQSSIIKELSEAFAYCYVGTTTMTGSRDIMLYINSRDQEKAAAILNKVKADNERFLAYTFEPDAEWEAVASFYDAIPIKH